ncbi:MAG: DegT/DnrJ/EryC1/StrS family aminotransferase [Deltaproteobacteria bacterium]|nr:MAG: DegT/DnrJ/EryC1/StrS family aminotransferase [Deltaproteobacteria bacterium]
MTTSFAEDSPAVLDGVPCFSEPIKMVRPFLPAFSELAEDMEQIVASGWLTNGPHVRALEEAAAQALDVPHVVAVSSCTSGLMLLAQCLDLEGEVILPSFTFMASATSMAWKGCRPVFVDVDPHTTNLIPEQVEQAISPITSAILAVHNFGNPAPCDSLESIADRYNLHLIYDAAHGLGSTHHRRPVGKQGTAQCFSLSPTKLVTGGEGGLVATSSADLAKKLRAGRDYGNPGNYDCLFPGLNARMSEFHALLARRSLAQLPEAVSSRQKTAAQFQQAIAAIPGLRTQRISPNSTSSYKDFAVIVDEMEFGLTRDMLRQALTAEGIDTRTYYDPPVHKQTAFRNTAKYKDLPHTECLSRNIVCLPLWSHMPDDIVEGIIASLQRIKQNAPLIRTQLIEHEGLVGDSS